MRLDFALLALVAPLAALGNRHSHRSRNHSDLAKRADASVQLHKRFENTRWTFYDVGGAAGACGKFNTPDQHIVALNSAQYGGGYPGPNCWKTIVMTYNGKTTTAQITDECPGCPFGGLDLTRGLFEFFGPLSLGVLQGSWHFADDGPPPPPPKPTPKPTHKTTPPPPPPPPTTHHTTSTHTPTTTSTHATESATHSSPASSSHASSVSTNYSSGVASGLAIPTGTVSTDNGEAQNVLAYNKLLVNLGGLIVAGAEAA